jgi:hypothetical protein
VSKLEPIWKSKALGDISAESAVIENSKDKLFLLLLYIYISLRFSFVASKN